jgi:predicted amidophosphoribosyltransferase
MMQLDAICPHCQSSYYVDAGLCNQCGESRIGEYVEAREELEKSLYTRVGREPKGRGVYSKKLNKWL